MSSFIENIKEIATNNINNRLKNRGFDLEASINSIKEKIYTKAMSGDTDEKVIINISDLIDDKEISYKDVKYLLYIIVNYPGQSNMQDFNYSIITIEENKFAFCFSWDYITDFDFEDRT